MGDKDHIFVLSGIKEVPFPVGKKLLCKILMGSEDDSIRKNNLETLECYGSMAYEEEEIKKMLDDLIKKGLIEQKPVPNKKFIQGLYVTDKGENELKEPGKIDKPLGYYPETKITEQDKVLFNDFDFFLNGYDDEQNKSIISNAKSILCVAGAGSGKTTVLTKRIEFMIKFRNVKPEKILAITFTRKAKQEMIFRLNKLGCDGVNVETFNSFCEKFLKKYNNLIYDTPVKVIDYKDKIKLVQRALNEQDMDLKRAVDRYFSGKQKNLKTEDQLNGIFVNDCFTILDNFKRNYKDLEDFSKYENLPKKEKDNARMIFNVCKFIKKTMEEEGMRDFTDQLVDGIKLFKENPDVMPGYDHILVDEYQDVNEIQINLLDLLNPNNLFCVGDPRQSIFGWRGSKIEYILNFEDKYKGCEIVTLTNNYRSSPAIVEFMNESIKSMQMPKLKSVKEAEKDITIEYFPKEEEEFSNVVEKIKENKLEDCFVLARTNKTLLSFSERLKKEKIHHNVKSEDVKRGEGGVTLATVHAIKGMENKKVFVIGCNNKNFPCKSSDHPILDSVKIEDYDKFEEELRLFYVAISRAEDSLHLSYHGKKSYFINEGMEKILETKDVKKMIFINLQFWRSQKANKERKPHYFIIDDYTMEEISREQPSSLIELENIKGMDRLRILKYGREIIKLVENSV